MGLKAGIVGLPNVGKSTLFNAINQKNLRIEFFLKIFISKKVYKIWTHEILLYIYLQSLAKPEIGRISDLACLIYKIN